MKIYFAHPRHDFDYEKELYQPLRSSALNSENKFILPHDKEMEGVQSKDIIRSCDIFCAEVSQPATGVGIELGWADSFNVPVFCFHKKGTRAPGSLKYIAKKVVEYSDSDDLLNQLSEVIKRI